MSKQKLKGSSKKPPVLKEVIKDDSELDSEFSLEDEVDWCIKYMEHALRTATKQTVSQRKGETMLKAIEVLKNKNATLPSKRMAMRNGIGDYRILMKQEKTKVLKESLPSMKPTSAPTKSSLFRKKAATESQSSSNEEFFFNFALETPNT